MTSSLPAERVSDQTALPLVVRASVLLGLLESLLVVVFSLATRFLEGPPELLVQSLIVLVGLALVTVIPGRWTRARTIEGIAGAGGIGLGAAVCFLIVDIVLLQRIGIYSHRWLAIGGGSNWWYHPVWWMAGTAIPLLGAWAMANQGARSGSPSPGGVLVMAIGFALVLGVVATLIGFPGASISLPTFAIAFLPALPLTVLATGRGGRGGRR